jgi:hypothetical protein
MEQTERSRTFAFKLQTPVNHPEQSIQAKDNKIMPDTVRCGLKSKILRFV